MTRDDRADLRDSCDVSGKSERTIIGDGCAAWCAGGADSARYRPMSRQFRVGYSGAELVNYQLFVFLDGVMATCARSGVRITPGPVLSRY